MAVNLPPCPLNLKPIAHYLKTAQEHDNRDIVVAYWARLYALQTGLKLSSKQAEETALLIGKNINYSTRLVIFNNIVNPLIHSNNGMVRNCQERKSWQ